MLVFPKQVLYLTFALNPEVDWTETAVAQTWREYGSPAGRFLSVETPLTLAELTILCQAYTMQHGSPKEEKVRPYSLEYQLQKLFEQGIVNVAAWQPFYISRDSSIEPVKKEEGR